MYYDMFSVRFQVGVTEKEVYFCFMCVFVFLCVMSVLKVTCTLKGTLLCGVLFCSRGYQTRNRTLIHNLMPSSRLNRLQSEGS